MKRVIGFAIVLLGLACSSPAALVGYWNFSETSGNIAHNQVAGEPDGTLLGGAHFTTTDGLKDPHCVRLDNATGDLIDFGNNYNFTGSFSVVIWVKLDPGNTAAMVPLSKFDSVASHNGYLIGDGKIAVGRADSRDVYPQFIESGSSSGQLLDPLNDGSWHMVVGVYDTSDPTSKQCQIFDPVRGGGGLSGASPISSSNADFLIGGLTSTGVPLNAFTGWIDEVRVYDSVLSGDQQSQIYSSSIPEPSMTFLIPILLLIQSFRTLSSEVAGDQARRI